MNKFKLHTNKEVLKYNLENIKPDYTHNDYSFTSFSMTKKNREKLEQLRAKYKISRSSIIRILLDSVE